MLFLVLKAFQSFSSKGSSSTVISFVLIYNEKTDCLQYCQQLNIARQFTPKIIHNICGFKSPLDNAAILKKLGCRKAVSH